MVRLTKSRSLTNERRAVRFILDFQHDPFLFLGGDSFEKGSQGLRVSAIPADELSRIPRSDFHLDRIDLRPILS